MPVRGFTGLSWCPTGLSGAPQFFSGAEAYHIVLPGVPQACQGHHRPSISTTGLTRGTTSLPGAPPASQEHSWACQGLRCACWGQLAGCDQAHHRPVRAQGQQRPSSGLPSGLFRVTTGLAGALSAFVGAPWA